MKSNSKPTKAQLPTQSRSHINRNLTNVNSLTYSKQPSQNSISSYQTVVKKNIALQNSGKILQENDSLCNQNIDPALSGYIKSEISKYIHNISLESRVSNLENEQFQIRNALSELQNVFQVNTSLQPKPDSFLNSQIQDIHRADLDKTSKSTAYEIQKMTKTLNDKLSGSINSHNLCQPLSARTQQPNVHSNNCQEKHSLVQETNKLEQIKENLKEINSSDINLNTKKTNRPVAINNYVSQSLNTGNFSEGMLFRSMQNFSVLNSNIKGKQEKLPVSKMNFSMKTKTSPQKVNKQIFPLSEQLSNRDLSNQRKNHNSQFKCETSRSTKKHVLSMNVNSLSQILKDMKKTRHHQDFTSKSLNKHQRNFGNPNQTYLSQSQNSNFVNFKENSVNHRSKNQDEDMNENDNTAPFNFSNEHSKFNQLSQDEEPKIQSVNSVSSGIMKMDRFLPKPSSCSQHTISPENRKKSNPILIQQNILSAKTVKAMSPTSLSPTSKKSNLSTLEENCLEMQVRTIGQSLTERLQVISLDKKTKFNSISGNTLHNIIQTLKSKDQSCKCSFPKNFHKLSSNLSSRRQSRQQYGIYSTVMTPTKDDSHLMIKIEDGSKTSLPCGDFCIKLDPTKQKEIIRDIMKKDYGPNLKVFANKGDSGFPNERKYILEAKWWRNWCDYTSFEGMDINLQSQGEKPNSFKEYDSLNDETIMLSCEGGTPQLFLKKSQKTQFTDKKGAQSTTKINNRYKNVCKKKEQGKITNGKVQLLDFDKQEVTFSQNLEMLREEIIKKKKLCLNETYSSQSNNLEKVNNTRDKGKSENNRQVVNDYKHPGIIKNKRLVDENMQNLIDNGIENFNFKLKEDLFEHHDYEAVSAEIWKYISSWYQYDITITRYLVFDGKTQKTVLELYPQIQF